MENVEIEITKVGERGQIVIPKNIRIDTGMRVGSVIEIIRADDLVLLKRIEPQIDKKDIKVLEKITKAWKEIDEGKSKRYTEEEFKKKLLAGKL